MDSDNKRIEIDNLPQAEEELTDDQARDVKGGATNTWNGPVTLGTSSPIGNTVGGSLTNVQPDPTRKAGDGSV